MRALLLVLALGCGVGYQVDQRPNDGAVEEATLSNRDSGAEGQPFNEASTAPSLDNGECTLPDCQGTNVQDPGAHHMTPNAR